MEDSDRKPGWLDIPVSDERLERLEKSMLGAACDMAASIPTGFVVNNKAELLSGGCVMLVTAIKFPNVACQWIDDHGHMQQAEIHHQFLRHHQEAKQRSSDGGSITLAGGRGGSTGERPLSEASLDAMAYLAGIRLLVLAQHERSFHGWRWLFGRRYRAIKLRRERQDRYVSSLISHGRISEQCKSDLAEVLNEIR